jgi:tetratricopeptide (TPR) repeat protein
MADTTSTKSLFRKLKTASSRDLSALTVLLGRDYVSQDTKNGVAWLMLGIGLVETGQYDDARKALMRATKLCPPDKLRIPFAQLGHLYKQKGSFMCAAKWYQKSIDSDPNDASAHIYLGSVFAREGKLHDAEHCHRAATRCKRGCIDEAYLNLGLVLRAQGKLKAAADALEMALKLDPKYKAAKEALVDINQALEYTVSRQFDGNRSRRTRRRTTR